MNDTVMRHGTGHGIRIHMLAVTLAVAPWLGLAGTASADPAALAAADPGRVDAKLLKKCAKCHYETGISDDPEMPHLAGQVASYMYKQLQDFKADRRDGGRMNKIASKLSDQQMADLSLMYTAKTLPPEDGVAALPAPGQVGGGEGCASCHGDDGRGKKDKYDAPALAGMPYDYFVLAMEGFRDGDRSNDADGVMGKAAKPLGDDDITALAEYYLALGQRKRMPPP
jgi:cytochrome c553